MPVWGPPSIVRAAAATAVVTATLVSSGVTFTIIKNSPTESIRAEKILEVKSSSKVDKYFLA